MEIHSLLNDIDQDLCRYRQIYSNELTLIKKLFYGFMIFFAFSGFRSILLYRLSHFSIVNQHKYFRVFLEVLKRFLSPIQISSKTVIKGGIQIPYASCITIGGGEIGTNCSIYSGVIIGVRKSMEDNFPIIGNNVSIFSGAKILGNVKIGDNAKIGANAVVIRNVPDNATAVGIPAKIYKKQSQK